MPFGVPRPVGPSYPVRAVQRYDELQLPLLPDRTSNSEVVCAYGLDPKLTEPPLTPYAPATIGAAALVPPNTSQSEASSESGANTATPVLGSAIADTSATVRREHPVSCCQLGFENLVLQPLPAPLHAVSV